MSPCYRKRWILRGAWAICLAVMTIPWGLAVADNREGAVSGRWNEVSSWEEVRRVAQAGEVTPEKLERWRTMTPEEREKVRERYRRWKELPPERKERILERRKSWRELPEGQRHFLMKRREIYRTARPEEKRTIEEFVRHFRQLPPERRHAMRQRLAEWKDLPAVERNERLGDWAFYRNLSPGKRKTVNRFLFPEPPSGPRRGPPGPPRD